MQKIVIAFLFISLFFSGCKKTTNTTTTTPAAYYIKYTLDGVNYYNKSQVFQAGSNDITELGGWCNSETNFYNAAGLVVTFKDSITKSEVLTMAGKTFYFDKTSTSTKQIVDVTLKHNVGGQYIYSTSTTDHSYFLTINTVSFLKNDGLFNIYNVKGTFKAKMDFDNSIYKDATSGDFNMMWSTLK